MAAYLINEFSLETNLILPFERNTFSAESPSRTTFSPLNAIFSPGILDRDFSFLHPTARRDHGMLWAYDTQDGILLTAAGFLRMHVNSTGESILLDAPDKEAGFASRALLGYGLAICTLLRGGVPLHGATIDMDGVRIGLLAPSGTGKSTLLWWLIHHCGAMYVTDDIIPLNWISAEQPNLPSQIFSYPAGALEPRMIVESFNKIRGLHIPHNLLRVAGDATKMWVPIESRFRSERIAPLDVLLILEPQKPLHETRELNIQFIPIRGGEIVTQLRGHTFGVWTISGHVQPVGLLQRWFDIASQIPLYRVVYEKRVEILTPLCQGIREMAHKCRADKEKDSYVRG